MANRWTGFADRLALEKLHCGKTLPCEYCRQKSGVVKTDMWAVVKETYFRGAQKPASDPSWICDECNNNFVLGSELESFLQSGETRPCECCGQNQGVVGTDKWEVEKRTHFHGTESPLSEVSWICDQCNNRAVTKKKLTSPRYESPE